MSKMEILQNNKEKAEIQKDHEILESARDVWKKVNTTWWLIFWTGTGFSFLLNLFILYYGFTLIESWGDLSLFVGLIASATLFQKVVDNSTILYKEFTNEFSSVQKLWDTFSSIPKMKNEFKDIPFKYKSGNIEIKNVTFWYTENRNVFEQFSLDIKWWTKTAFLFSMELFMII